MKEFGFKKISSHYIPFLKRFHFGYIGLIFICYTIFALYNNITQLIFSQNKYDIFAKNLKEIALYSSVVDPQLAKFVLTLDEVTQSYLSGENIFSSRIEQIEFLFSYVLKNENRVKNYGFQQYDNLISFISSLYPYRKEIYELFGAKKRVNYLIILQNDSERRPNGGFFGSFALVTLENGFIKKLKIIDSYWPNYIAPKSYVLAPDRSSAFLPDLKIGFISANKFGFTDIDGKNIKDLYEKIYPEDVKGVVFLRSSFFESLIPGFQEKIWEWQFVNASIDLIRGKELPNKKEIYIKEISDYFNDHKYKIFQKFVNNFQFIKEKKYINIYLSNVSKGIQSILSLNGFKTVFNTGYMYFWDSNNSFNKIDSFVKKNIQIKSLTGIVYVDSDRDIVSLKSLPKGSYRSTITYSLNLTDNYRNFISSLEQKYNIKMQTREKYILAIDPIWWATRSTLYFDDSISIYNLTGDLFNSQTFNTHFGKGLFYQLNLEKNNTTKSFSFDFTR